MLDAPGDGGDRPRDRPVAERVLRQNASPSGRSGPESRRALRRAGSRGSRRRRRTAGPRGAAASGRLPRRGGRRRRCGCRARRRRPAAGAARPGSRTSVSLLAGDDVRRGHDEVAAGDPAAPLDADAAGRAEHLDDAGGGGADRLDCGERPCSAAASAPSAPMIDGNGSMRASRLSSVRGGSAESSCLTIAERSTSWRNPVSPGVSERDRRADPDDRERRSRRRGEARRPSRSRATAVSRRPPRRNEPAMSATN